MEGTRTQLLNYLDVWSKDRAGPRIFWLDGMAGTGKSAIARTFCRTLRGSALLGGSFFCSRGTGSRENARRILPTLAWFLARRDSKYRAAILSILSDIPNIADETIDLQIEHLLKEPLRKAL